MWFEWSGVGSLFLVHMPALQNMPTICNHNLNQHHHGASSYMNIPWLHRYHPSANTPPPPLILTSTIYRARAILQFRDWWLACNEQPLFSWASAQFQTTHCKKWCTIMIHHRLGVLHQWTTVDITSDISIGPLRDRAWSLVPSTRRTTSTHHPLQVLTNGSWRGSEDRS